MRKPSTPISIRIVSHSVIAACVVAIGLIPATAATGMDDLERLASWLTGRWDNRAQAEAEVARGAPPDERHPRYAMEYVRLNTPHLAGVTFAIRNYGEHGLAGPLRRVSLHRFELAADETTIVHEFMFLKDQAGWGDLGVSLGPLTALRPTDVTTNPGCRMYWSWQGDRFEARPAGASRPQSDSGR